MKVTVMRTFLSTALAVLFSASAAREVHAATLVDNPFISSYQNWIDPFPERAGRWRIHPGNHTMTENSGPVPAGGDDSAAGNTFSGNFVPTILLQDGFTSPGTYDYTARLYTSDDDGFGVVFGYQPNGDYFRASFRQQTTGNFGFSPGLTVQKVIGGVVTQLNPAGPGAGNLLVPTQSMIDNRTPIDVRVAVNGNNYDVYVAGLNGDMPLQSGSDTDLAAGKVGVFSWAQHNDTAAAVHWGTEIESVGVSDAGGTLYSGTFTGIPVSFRNLYMTNSAGLSITQTAAGEDFGAFGLDFANGWISDTENGFEYATAITPNVDFLGPAIVVDEPGATNLGDYTMKVRLGSNDNDGLGVLVRVQDDENFYRVHFSTEAIDAGTQRAPAGLSVQKVKNGVWSELFRDDQGAPLFLPTVAAGTPGNGLLPFDLSVNVEGNEITVQVIDDLGSIIDYPVITDAVDPILTGSVGLTLWGNTGTYWLPYGGVPGPLVEGEAPPMEMPDLNMDGFVDIFDVNLVSANWGGPGPAGDANKDGIVDIFDVNLISANWDPPPAPGGGSAVPEPATWLLAGACLACVAFRRLAIGRA